MTKVKRKLVYNSVFLLEYGLSADGTAPAEEAVKLLAEKQWRHAEADEYPDEIQASMYTRLRDLMRRLAGDEDLPPGSFNRLNEGIWELKVNNFRVTFYDTDGTGGFEPKLGRATFGWDQKRAWELPLDFDKFIRLGVCWEKDDDKARPEDVDRSLAFRIEDLAHDRPESEEIRNDE